MNQSTSKYVDIAQLRVGMYVELDLRWIAHPFPRAGFKLSSSQQIETIKSLGLQRVRIIPSKSDYVAEASTWGPESSAVTRIGTVPSLASDAQSAQALKQSIQEQKKELRAQYQRSLVKCEKRFGDTIAQYKQIFERVQTLPAMAKTQCVDVVASYVSDLLTDGQMDGANTIRLLSDGMGDRASIHPVNVTIVSLLLGKFLKLSESELVHLGTAAFLHDLGKVNLAHRVQSIEPGFTETDLKLYRSHVEKGVMFAQSMGLDPEVIKAISQHHEMADGSGFPMGCEGHHMSMISKILAVVNKYDGLCNPSRTNKSITPHEAMALIYAKYKTKFDNTVLNAFIRMMGVYPPGSVVQLSNDQYAIVVSVNASRPLKPNILIYHPNIPKQDAEIFDMAVPSTGLSIGIKRSLKPDSLPIEAMDYLSPRKNVCYFFDSAIESSQSKTPL